MQPTVPVSAFSIAQDAPAVNQVRSSKYLVTWDFSKKPSGAFYTILDQEYGPQGPQAYELIQRSVAVCRDDFLAYRIAALAEHYGAVIAVYQVSHNGYESERKEEAREAIERLLQQRIARRGRRRRE